jgi:RimJ/RimL family protein N-acetyltransferase
MNQQQSPKKDLSDVIIKTERLVLKPITLSYDQDIFREYNENVTKYTVHGPNESIEAVDEFIKSSMEQAKNGESLTLVVVGGEFFGLADIKRTNTATPEFGLWLKESAQGAGYGSELIFALADWAQHNLDFDYLIYRADKENVGSWKIAEKLLEKYGGKYVGEVAEAVRGRNIIARRYHIARVNNSVVKNTVRMDKNEP